MIAFITTTGRSGSYAIYKMLEAVYPELIVRHQHACVSVQKIGTLRYMRLISPKAAQFKLSEDYSAPEFYMDWIDVSNKLSWVVSELRVLYPEARFINLVRDGRKVCLSYYHKLDVYNRADVIALSIYLKRLHVAPPFEERYWWPFDPTMKYDRWAYLCWHWQENIRQAERVNPVTYHFEDIVLDPRAFLAELGLTFKPEALEMLKRPVNVIEPKNYKLTPEQERVYFEICGKTHRRLGYAQDDYEVSY